jgi:succinate dehydrogenase/fumarate reductase cytochrome b subunit
MNVTLIKALGAAVPVSMLFAGAVASFFRRRTLSSCLQLLGAGCLVIVICAHICEALHLFPWMRWGNEYSADHYLDFASAVLGLTAFPAGYLLHALLEPR